VREVSGKWILDVNQGGEKGEEKGEETSANLLTGEQEGRFRTPGRGKTRKGNPPKLRGRIGQNYWQTRGR